MHQGADAPLLPLAELQRINDEFRLPNGEVDPGRLDEWANRMSEAYPAVTPAQVRAIYDYTTDAGYREMNPYLRDGAGAPPSDAASLEARIADLTQGLANLPSEPSFGATYFRGAGMTPDFLDQFTVGERWSDPGFMSASTDPGTLGDFIEAAKVEGLPAGVLTIDGRTPSAVSLFSRYQHETEYLFQRNTEFTVVSKHQDDFGTWHIHLREATR